MTSTPEYFAEFLQAEIARYAKIIKASGIQPE
jgi:tripartite-type tricarboxylate transporter receptor subunit TctC